MVSNSADIEPLYQCALDAPSREDAAACLTPETVVATHTHTHVHARHTRDTAGYKQKMRARAVAFGEVAPGDAVNDE